GRTQSYRRGHHALTAVACESGPGGLTVRIAAPRGDRSVVPAGRRHRLQLRLPRVTAVQGEGDGALSSEADDPRTGTGWRADAEGFVHIRLPVSPAADLTVRVTT